MKLRLQNHLNMVSAGITSDYGNEHRNFRDGNEPTAAIGTFEKLVTAPRGQIATRSALLKEVATDTATLLEDLRDLDNLIPQFTNTPEGQRFAQAWKTARIIVDAGGGHGDDEEFKDEEEPPTPPAPQAPEPSPAPRNSRPLVRYISKPRTTPHNRHPRP